MGLMNENLELVVGLVALNSSELLVHFVLQHLQRRLEDELGKEGLGLAISFEDRMHHLVKLVHL